MSSFLKAKLIVTAMRADNGGIDDPEPFKSN